MREAVIVSAVRTPIGSFNGSLSSVTATQLGATAIKGAIEKAGIDKNIVDEVFMGCVLQAGLGQAPARQAAIYAGLSEEVPCTTVNKVCASGMKAVMMAAQAIAAGDADVIVAGGMENMSRVPHYLPGSRTGTKLGNITMLDGMVFDGLTDAYKQEHMGNCGDLCAREYNISREEQDTFALNSYKKATEAWESGAFDSEVVPVAVPQRKGDPVMVKEDEEFRNIIYEKVPNLRPVFSKDGTVTAANASTLNDGAAALVIMSAEKAEELGLKPLARIKGYADAAQAPEWFTTAPSKAIPKALKKAKLEIADIDFWELNEAFAVVGLANIKELGLDASRVDVNGGAVALGHPLGASGARILVTLIHILHGKDGKYGCAGICNGGGGASALVLERG